MTEGVIINRRKRLTVVIHDLNPPPRIGEEVGVMLDGMHVVRGWILQRLSFDTFRVEIDPDAEL